LKVGEVFVVDTFSTSQLPNPLDWIEFGAVGWQEIELEFVRVQVSPGFVKPGVVIFSIVHDHDNASTRATGAAFQMFEKIQIGCSIEFSRLALADQLSIAQADGAKVSDTLACRMMADYRVLDLWRNPHPAARTTLLKVDLVFRPEIDTGIAAQGF
jgi:hypothetical protein